MYPNDQNNYPQPQGVPQPPVTPPMPVQPQSVYPQTPPAAVPPSPQPPLQQQPQPPQQPYQAPQPVAPSPQPSFTPGASGMPSPYAVDPSAFKKRQSAKKLTGIIWTSVYLLIAVGMGLWSFFTYNKGVTLERYEGDGYSILAPKEYTKEARGQDTVWTSEKYKSESGSDDTGSALVVSVDRTPRDDIDEVLYDSAQQDIIKGMTSSFGGSDITVRDVVTKKDDYRGMPARTITANIYSGDSMTGAVRVRMIFTKKGIYMVMVAAHQQVESGFRNSAEKILDSFEIKE